MVEAEAGEAATIVERGHSKEDDGHESGRRPEPADPSPSSSVLRTVFRVLTFRASREELLALDWRHLIFGLSCTWIVGMGRYWDDPGAGILQHLGVGSLVYVFVLSALLWLLLKPMGAEDWSYRRVLTFVTLTAPPAILYAIPVERFVELETAQQANMWFLASVALWRVALYVFLVRRLGRLHWFGVVVGSLLPLTFIVSSLAYLNLERAVFEIMAGLSEGTANDSAYLIVLLLTYASIFAFLPLLVFWLIIVRTAWTERRAERPRAE